MLLQTENSQAMAAAKAGLSIKTARKYRQLKELPGEAAVVHTWRTRPDPFADVWPDVHQELAINPGLQAKVLFQVLQQKYPGRFQDGQLRSFQRGVKTWRALAGPPREVFFAQVHEPGQLCESDFTHLAGLGVTIGGQPFDHMIYHFVLTYSNWEHGTICFSESYESLCQGLQNALWTLGGVPAKHRTDRLSAAVNNLCGLGQAEPTSGPPFTQRYQTLLDHYGLRGQRIQASKANENGDVEQRHHRFKQALEQALLLRGSRDFASRPHYETVLVELFEQLNAGRRGRLAEELPLLHRLPPRRIEDYLRLDVKVDTGSLIHVDRNTYSVNSRLIGETVQVRLYAEHLEIWYAQRRIEQLERLRGRQRHRVNYRHIIDWLVRKPGAFEQYRYRQDLFPTSRFRMAYDQLKDTQDERGVKTYLRILHLAARQSQDGVDEALRHLLQEGQPISLEAVEDLVSGREAIPPATQVHIDPVDLAAYDALMIAQEVTV